MRVAWLLLVIVPFAYLFNVLFPVLSPQVIQQKAKKFRALGLLHWEDGQDHALPQDFADMLGWREMAALALKAYEEVPEPSRAHTLVICGNYGQAGALNYYGDGKLPFALSFNADYIFWFPPLEGLQYIILVDDEEPDEHAHRFSTSIEKIGQVSNPLAREYGTGVYLLKGIKPEAPAGLRTLQRQQVQELRAW